MEHDSIRAFYRIFVGLTLAILRAL
jgi:hypothetical protein